MAHQWSNAVTHVIVRCGADGCTERTLKYLYGVVAGVWVLRVEWVQRCVEQGHMVPEVMLRLAVTRLN